MELCIRSVLLVRTAQILLLDLTEPLPTAQGPFSLLASFRSFSLTAETMSFRSANNLTCGLFYSDHM